MKIQYLSITIFTFKYKLSLQTLLYIPNREKLTKTRREQRNLLTITTFEQTRYNVSQNTVNYHLGRFRAVVELLFSIPVADLSENRICFCFVGRNEITIL